MTTHNAILIKAYEAKAVEALDLARRARSEGRQAAHSGYLSECLYWRALADAVAHRPEQTGQEVTHT